MTSHTVPEAFAAAAARLTRGNDAAGSLLALLRDCAWLMDADAVGILKSTATGHHGPHSAELRRPEPHTSRLTSPTFTRSNTASLTS